MWDDMMRNATVDQLLKRGLDKLVKPVIWNYGSIIAFPTGMLERYQTVWGDEGTLAGTAWRGATGSNVCVTTIKHHVDNHLAWLSVIREVPGLVAGWILTGWARYGQIRMDVTMHKKQINQQLLMYFIARLPAGSVPL